MKKIFLHEKKRPQGALCSTIIVVLLFFAPILEMKCDAVKRYQLFHSLSCCCVLAIKADDQEAEKCTKCSGAYTGADHNAGADYRAGSIGLVSRELV